MNAVEQCVMKQISNQTIIYMKYLFSLMLMLFVLAGVNAQSAFSIKNSRAAQGGDYVEAQQVSLRNPWVGAKLSYALSDPNTDLTDNFIFSARVMYEAASGDKYSVPVVSTISPIGSDPLSPESGYNIGVFPYYILKGTSTFTLVLHGGVNYKVIPQGSDPSVQQLRVLAGVEAALNQEGKLPITLSVTPVYYVNDLGAETLFGNSFGIEATGIVPISEGLGVLAEYQLPFTSEVDGTFRVGVIVNGVL